MMEKQNLVYMIKTNLREEVENIYNPKIAEINWKDYLKSDTTMSLVFMSLSIILRKTCFLV